MSLRFILALLFLPALSSCTDLPTDEFVSRLQAHCGKAYAGKVVSTDPQDDDFRKADIVVEIRCTPERILMPLHVGEDHSRAWWLRRTEGKGAPLKLTHLHLHEDGTEDTLSRYGGVASNNSSGSRQNFPAGESTKSLFDAEGIPVSKQNVWAIEVRPAANLIAYEMARPERFFRIEFDTATPVEPPEEFWGKDFEFPEGF